MDFRGNYGLREQVQTGVRPGLRLHSPYSAHTGPETFLEIPENFLSKQIDWSTLCGAENTGIMRTSLLLPLYIVFSFSYYSSVVISILFHFYFV